MERHIRKYSIVLCIIFLLPKLVYSQPLTAYAKECEQAIGAKIPSFNCLNGAIIPMQGVEGRACAKPPYLGGVGCHKYSRLGKIPTSNPHVDIRFLCRHYKKAESAQQKMFNDIALIARNVKSGATCFFQTKTGRSVKKNGTRVPSPSADNIKFWLPPPDVANMKCAGCHDSDPFIRTPHLMQVKGYHALPVRRNGDAYWFPGSDFRNWKVYDVKSTKNNGCANSACHKMGASNLGGSLSSSGGLGAYAIQRNRFGLESPRVKWMARTAKYVEDFKAINRCANNHHASGCIVKERAKPRPPQKQVFKWLNTPANTQYVNSGQNITLVFKASGGKANYRIGHPQDECRWDRPRQVGNQFVLTGVVPRYGVAFTTRGAVLSAKMNRCRVTVMASRGRSTLHKTITFVINNNKPPKRLKWVTVPNAIQWVRRGRHINLNLRAVGAGSVRYSIGHPHDECSWDSPRQVRANMQITGVVPHNGRFTLNGKILQKGVNRCNVKIIAQDGRSTIAYLMRFNIQ